MSPLKLERKEETWSIKVIIPICGDCGGEKKTEEVNDSQEHLEICIVPFQNVSERSRIARIYLSCQIPCMPSLQITPVE